MDIRRTKLLFGGMAGFCSIAVVQMLSLSKEDFNNYLMLALYCFAIGLPFSILGTLMSHFKENYKKTFEESEFFSNMLALFAIAVPYFGIILLLWHFNSWLSIIFVISSVIASSMFSSWDKKIKSLNKSSKKYNKKVSKK